jgi:hypothetical protein
VTGLNIAGTDFGGTQIAAAANFAGGRLRGAQLAAGLNYSRGPVSGAQIAAGMNYSGGPVSGAQIAAGLNVADAVDGAQIGVLNLANTTDGAQVGVVNLARRGRGFNVGVVNIAGELNGEAFGVINLIGNGIHSVAVYATDSMLSNLELKLGSRHLYTSFQMAYHPGDALAVGPERFETSSRRYAFGMGLGWRQSLVAGRLKYAEVELSQLAMRSSFTSHGWGFGGDDGSSPLLASLRVLVGIEIATGLNAMVGISGNTSIAWGGRDLDIGSGFMQATQHSGKATVREYPGLVLGLQM